MRRGNIPDVRSRTLFQAGAARAQLSNISALKAGMFAHGCRGTETSWNVLERPGTPSQQQNWVDVRPASDVLNEESPWVLELST